MLRALTCLVLVAAVAHAQPQQDDEKDDAALAAKDFDPAMCDQFLDDATPASPTDPNMAPTPFAGFELSGRYVDSAPTVRALFTPTVARHNSLTNELRTDLVRSAKAFGYHVVGIGIRDIGGGKQNLVVHIEPLPIVRLVDVDPGIPWYGAVLGGVRLLHDDVRRRMRARTGSYLAWNPIERRCELEQEKERIIEYLHDEGYFDAQVSMVQKVSGVGVTIRVKLDLGTPYETAVERITVERANELSVGLAEIREKFKHKGTCVFGKGATAFLCYGPARFTRAQHQADLQAVAKMFKDRGYPAVRVDSDFSPSRSIDRRTKTVRFQIRVDERRRLEVWFEGHDPDTVKEEDLRKQLTFNDASSSDDVEAEASAAAIAAFLQTKGFFDARVTWIKERFGPLDKLVFRIEQGKRRSVQSVEVIGVRALKRDLVDDQLGTKTASASRSLFGGSTAATSEMLGEDVKRLVDLYRRNGYRDARVRVTASTVKDALDSAALTAALVSANKGEGLYVRFTIDEGLPTLVTQVHVELGDDSDTITPENKPLCEQLLKDLAEMYKHPPLATPVGGRCIAMARDLPFREDEAATTGDQLKDRLFSRGRPRAEVQYEPVVLGPRRIAAKYKVDSFGELKVGKVVIRGNFKTRASIIRSELGLAEGSVLTSDKLADGARRLRNTALFDSVNIAMPDLETTGTGEVNAVIEVTERHDYTMGVGAEFGYSSFNGAFFKLLPSLQNMFGIGIALDLQGTIGFELAPAIDDGEVELRQLAGEANLRFPRFLARRLGVPELIAFQTDLNAFHRRQETERFGLLRTTGATVSLSRTWDRPRSEKNQARAITVGLHYDYRSRERNVDALRPIGADDDDSQVPITTITGSAGVSAEWEQRVDRRGTLSPLAPEAGFRLDAQLSFASPVLLGQDTFLKAQASASKFFPLGSNVTLRLDARYDQGFPLGGAALLPEVERFFAGGDSTVRGYADDRLATELIQTGVPPLSNITQIRVLPAGGNIRVLGSVDLQYRVWWLFATGLFADAGMVKNQWSSVRTDDIRPSVGMTLARIVTPFGSFAFERAIPLRPQLGDDPRGRWHINFAARAQF